jgi:alpha-beta hydrolase superfamily lysophospholipase
MVADSARIAEVTASDGVRLRFRRWSSARPPVLDLVLLNGIMSNSAWFSPIVGPLSEAGVAIVGADRRGSAGNRDGRGDAPSAAQLVDDVVRILEASTDGSIPQVVLGWCWGAALAIAVAHRLRERVAGLVLVTPGMFSTAAVRDAMDAQRDRLVGAPHEAVLDSPIRPEWFTRGPALEEFVLRDPDRVLKISPRMVDIGAKLVTAAMARLGSLAVPLLVLLAEDDEATDNEATCAALRRVRGDRVDIVTLPGRHGLQFDAPQLVVDHVLSFAAGLGVSVPPSRS